MIEIKIQSQNGKFVSLSVKGHAQSAEAGKDLVCAAVSAVVTGAFNAIKEVKDFKFVLEEGNAELISLKTISAHDEIVIETLITQLRTIAESSPKFVKIN